MFNVTRATIAPVSLETEKIKANGSYNNSDVIMQLQSDFFNKCYLCEEKHISKIEIDHLKPHFQGQNINRKFDWGNLFYCCGHCNGTKGQLDVDLLDCTNSGTRPYDWILYEIVSLAPKIEIEVKSLVNQPEVDNTVALLNEIFNGKNPNKASSRILEAGNIRQKIADEVTWFQKELIAYLQDNSNLPTVISALSKQSAFKRQIIKSSLNENIKGLEQYFD